MTRDQPTRRRNRVNVIVLVSDTFRYDYLGCNGND